MTSLLRAFLLTALVAPTAAMLTCEQNCSYIMFGNNPKCVSPYGIDDYCMDMDPCPEFTIPCDAFMGEGRGACSKSHTYVDTGCTDDAPSCVDADGKMLMGAGDGDHCAVCVNSVLGDGDHFNKDHGCNSTMPVCVTDGVDLDTLIEGTECAVCAKSHPGIGNGRDDGCSMMYPLCVNADNTLPGMHHSGDKCIAQCTNTRISMFQDDGCNQDVPMCLNADLTQPAHNGDGVICSKCTAAECDDGNACTLSKCDPSKGCEVTPIDCDDADACTIDVCDSVLGCSNTPINCDAGFTCDPTDGVCKEDCVEFVEVSACLNLDGSESIDSNEFMMLQDFARNLTDKIAMKADPNHAEFAVVFFNEVATTVQTLTSDVNQAKNAIHFTPSGNTSINDGLVQCVQELETAQYDEKMIITVTDGIVTAGADPFPTASQAIIDGITLISVGVGVSLDLILLEDIATRLDLAFALDVFDSMDAQTIVDEIEATGCNEQTSR